MSLELLRMRSGEDPSTTVIGIGVIVVSNYPNGDTQILTVVEKEAKPETGKSTGERGIIQETVKVDEGYDALVIPEPAINTLWGAMAEVLSENDLRGMGQYFHRVVFLPDQNVHVPLASIGSRLGRVEVIVYDGSPSHVFNSHSGEVESLQWMPIPRFLNEPAVRPTSRELVEHAIRQSLVSFGLDQHGAGQTKPVFPEGFSLDEFNGLRDVKRDVTLFGRKES